jgi:hypothetical protein
MCIDTMLPSVYSKSKEHQGTDTVAICVAAGDDVGFVEESIANFAGDMCAKAVEVGFEAFQLLFLVSVYHPKQCGMIVPLESPTSSLLLRLGASSGFFDVFFRLSWLEGRVGFSASVPLPEAWA